MIWPRRSNLLGNIIQNSPQRINESSNNSDDSGLVIDVEGGEDQEKENKQFGRRASYV
jgi:hypothetical protein